MQIDYEWGPIIRAALRNKTGAALIAMQIAFTMTVVVNSVFMINERLGLIDRPSGLVENELLHVQSIGFGSNFDARTTVSEDLDLLRRTPGVADAVQINAIPLSGGGWSSGLRVEAGEDTQSWCAAMYMVDEHGIDTLGVKLLAGRNLAATDVRWREPNSRAGPDQAILTVALAKAMFPEIAADQVVGKTVYISNTQPIQIVGILARLQAPWVQWDNVEHAILIPQKTSFAAVRYMVRSHTGQRDTLMPIVEEALVASNNSRIIKNMESMGETRERTYALDSGLANLLVVVMVVLVLITGLGVLGLASFSVRRRVKEIGTRRALGATRGDIMRHFLVENLLITGVGVVLGAVMTIGLNIVLVDAMSFPKIDPLSVPAGMLVLLLVGQLAVLGPAWKACQVSPALATRTV